VVLLQRMQHTRAADSFRCRPDQYDRVGCPRFLAIRVAKSAVKIDNWLAVLPNRNRRAEFAKLLKILLKPRFQSLHNLPGFQLHCGIVGHQIMASDTVATAIALPILRAGVRTTAVCFRWARVLSYPRLRLLMSRSGIWSLLSARTSDKPRHFPAGRKARAAIALQQQRFPSRTCRRRTRDRNAGCGDIPDQA